MICKGIFSLVLGIGLNLNFCTAPIWHHLELEMRPVELYLKDEYRLMVDYGLFPNGSKYEDGHQCGYTFQHYYVKSRFPPRNEDQVVLDKIATEQLGQYVCKSGRCYYAHERETFICRSSSTQPIAVLIALLCVICVLS